MNYRYLKNLRETKTIKAASLDKINKTKEQMQKKGSKTVLP